ncbi:TonB-dependent receptor plug domain-containing protein [Qipengyuania flava]|uniref:TonB-dependent receptor plug domain-containing protein n=1 Tax=Qipengyuania flava TaxID=192812 RepID=UPI0018E04BE3|nr:TonB-dependent receptor plug domain-containing protein [Qipengyuania flava]
MMTFTPPFARGRRLALFTSAGIAALAISTPAFAQEVETNEEGQLEAAETPSNAIVVTGSRIASPTVESPAPLQVVDAQVIDDAGVTNIQEVLLENPVFGTPGLSRTNSAFLTSGTGVATVDLRDLGSDRTLVLINGRRVVGSIAGSATVDLNVIPTQFIDRIDILTGGASSLYGSDAIAGVVNFVYKENFEGIEANAQYGITEEGDDARYQANITAGTNLSGGDGNIMVHFGYSNEKGLLSNSRANTRIDDLDSIYFGGEFGDPTEPYYSSFPPRVASSPPTGPSPTIPTATCRIALPPMARPARRPSVRVLVRTVSTARTSARWQFRSNVTCSRHAAITRCRTTSAFSLKVRSTRPPRRASSSRSRLNRAVPTGSSRPTVVSTSKTTFRAPARS